MASDAPSGTAAAAADPAACRLCAGALLKAFDLQVLGRYQVDYLRCQRCGSLQTESPYWLEEAYTAALAAIDTGAVERCLRSQAAILATVRTCRVEGRLWDFGGGAGLLCRLLRDCGLDAWMYDKYAHSTYASAFVLQPAQVAPDSVALVSAIEVFEHCAQPAIELAPLFAARPAVVFASTEPYAGEGPEWWYLNASTGQHVFFYTTRGLELLAHSHGYHYVGVGGLHVFTRSALPPLRRRLLRLALSRRAIRAVRVWLALRARNDFAQADYERLTAAGGR